MMYCENSMTWRNGKARKKNIHSPNTVHDTIRQSPPISHVGMITAQNTADTTIAVMMVPKTNSTQNPRLFWRPEWLLSSNAT